MKLDLWTFLRLGVSAVKMLEQHRGGAERSESDEVRFVNIIPSRD
jgi:hypothetical protein